MCVVIRTWCIDYWGATRPTLHNALNVPSAATLMGRCINSSTNDACRLQGANCEELMSLETVGRISQCPLYKKLAWSYLEYLALAKLYEATEILMLYGFFHSTHISVLLVHS